MIEALVSLLIRFFIDPLITAFAEDIVKKHGLPTEQVLLLPSYATAARCIDFFKSQLPSLEEGRDLRAIALTPATDRQRPQYPSQRLRSLVVAVLFPRTYFPIAKTFWQHTGDGISSRRAEVFHEAFRKGQLMEDRQHCSSGASTMRCPQTARSPEPIEARLGTKAQIWKGPQRYRKAPLKEEQDATLGTNITGSSREINGADGKDHVQFVEERFGRNLDQKLGDNAKVAIRRRISGTLIADSDLQERLDSVDVPGRERGVPGFSVDDIYLYPSGMSSIFNTHRTLMKSRGEMKSICFGYVSLGWSYRIA